MKEIISTALMEVSEGHEGSTSMMDMMIMSKCAPANCNVYTMKGEDKLVRAAKLPPAAAWRVNRIPVSPTSAAGTISYASMSMAGSGAAANYGGRPISKSVPSSPTFATSSDMYNLQRNNLLASVNISAGPDAYKDPFSAQCYELQLGFNTSDKIRCPASASLSANDCTSLLAASLDLASSCASNQLAAAPSNDYVYVGAQNFSTASCSDSTPTNFNCNNVVVVVDPVSSSSTHIANYDGAVNHDGAKKRRLQQRHLYPFTSDVTAAAAAAAALDHVDSVPNIEAEMSTNNSPLINIFDDGDRSDQKVNNANLQTAPTTKPSTETSPSVEPQLLASKQDYIHVRARRGQATDSHSLAERVRREKISERMKFLQDLVPGCNKITGKAVMLDEIINYVQSLQRQVEFLSMKLSTISSPPRDDYDATPFVSNPNAQLMHHISQTSMIGNVNHDQHPHRNQLQHQHLSIPLVLDMQQQHVVQESPATGGAHVWEDELQSLVQRGYPNSS
ncbi:hypothetical protein GOP47_0004406 [Adiantum capillus-veneris]|uniref:BHLH domain-containing protein n=1 Tax=Adiantum capillus-veneris TaxID=13818 RepID=A0A9D4V7U1_ADICA|nr:hypothetical protein GOP47_0004406 [Adiantum capillus-veneris]